MIDRAYLVTKIGDDIGLIIKWLLVFTAVFTLSGWTIPIFVLISWFIVDHVVKKVVKPKIDDIKKEANTIIDI